MKEVVKEIIFGAMNSLPFRGHRDDGRIDLTDASQNDGIYRNHLRFSCASCNQTLKDFIDKPNTIINYVSKTTQNELHVIDLLGESGRSSLLTKIKANKFFTVMLDETMSATRKEEACLVIRFVNE